MITKKRFYKEKLLSATLTETLLVYLFILLAIASLYKQLIAEYKNAPVLGPDEIPVNIKLYNKLEKQANADSLLLVAKDSRIDSLINATTSKDPKDEKIGPKGVLPPSCILDNGSQRLLEIQFATDTTFLIKVINLENQIIKTKDYTLFNNQLMTLKINQFRSLGRQLHESRRINIGDRQCNPKINSYYYTDPYCYECLYVVVIKNRIDEFDGALGKLKLRRLFPLKKVGVPMNEVLYMSGIVGRYFSPIIG
jgi:hypothetical protein